MFGTNQKIIEKLRSDIRKMKENTDKVILLWTANTEQYLLPEINSIGELMDRIERNQPLPSSVLYCVAAIEEQILYLNGSP
jgi:myo-inositol-1-phosphate synthase